jgi:hypothetical protein
VNISKKTVTLFLDQDGRAILESTGVHLRDSAGVLVEVAETDDLGIWIRIDRQDIKHFFLVRWEYVLAVDFPDLKQPAVGVSI